VIGLVACSSQKLEHAAPARELYCSTLFRRSLAFAEPRCATVYVISAALELVLLHQVVKPYDRKLGSKHEREQWGRRVASTLIARHGREVEYLILAGKDYADPLATALRTHDGHRDGAWRGVPRDRILQPLRGLKIGDRLRKLNEWIGAAA
jgi:hypothetical protein